MALYALLLWKWFAWANALDAPMFEIYLLFTLVQYVWSPHTVLANLFIEPWLISLRFCAVVEAVGLCLAKARTRERKLILLLMLCVGVAGMFALHGYLMGPTLAEAYRAARQHIHVALALACVMGAACYALERLKVEPQPRNHFLILTAHLCLIAALGFFNPGKGQGRLYREIHIWYFAGSCACIAVWLRSGPLFFFALERRQSP